MTHLKIEQNSNIEVVTSGIIHKLYQITLAGDLDNLSNLKGNLQVAHAKTVEVNYLTNLFSQLNITMTGDPYMEFEDSVVENICSSNWGDGIGITTGQATTITKFNKAFKDNVNITTFNELQQFTNYTGTDHEFYDCSSLEEISLPANLTTIPSSMFQGCGALISFGNNNTLSNVRQINSWCFADCTNLPGTLNLPNCTTIQPNSLGQRYCGHFYRCTHLQKVVLGKITDVICPTTTYGDNTRPLFSGCSSLNVVDFGSEITQLTGVIFANCGSVKAIIIRNETPPSITNRSFTETWASNSVKIFVPDDALTTYQSTSPFSGYDSGVVLPLSQYVESDYITEP